MTAILRSRRWSTVVFLVSCAVPRYAEAQDFVCWSIARGDTAAGLALRLTGAAETAYTEAFQIRDPARQKFVPKSQYARLSADWQACVAREFVRRIAPAAGPARGTPPAPLAASAGPLPVAWAALLTLSQRDVVFAVTFGAGVSLVFLMISAASSYADGRPPPPALQRAGKEFLTAFATPLIDPTSPVPPIAGKLRFVRRKKRLEICIAPNGGRRYPNLADHKENVVYDVHRVLGMMGARRLVCDRLHAEGEWVVVSIRQAEHKEAGAK